MKVEFRSTHHQSKKHQINVHKIYAQSKEKTRRNEKKVQKKESPRKENRENKICDVKRYYRQREFIMYIPTCVYVKY